MALIASQFVHMRRPHSATAGTEPLGGRCALGQELRGWLRLVCVASVGGVSTAGLDDDEFQHMLEVLGLPKGGKIAMGTLRQHECWEHLGGLFNKEEKEQLSKELAPQRGERTGA